MSILALVVLLSAVGLHGRSFVPLLSSHACTIPGIMAARSMDNHADRLSTILAADQILVLRDGRIVERARSSDGPTLVVTPLPAERVPEFEVRIRWDKLPWGIVEPTAVDAAMGTGVPS